MNREEIIFWRDKYDKEEDRYNKGTEEELRMKFKENRYVVKEGLEEIIKKEFILHERSGTFPAALNEHTILAELTVPQNTYL